MPDRRRVLLLHSVNDIRHARIDARRVVPGVIRTQPDALHGSFGGGRRAVPFPRDANMVIRKRGVRRPRRGRLRHMARKTMCVFRVRGAESLRGRRGLQRRRGMAGLAGDVEIIGTRQPERLVRIVARRAIHRLFPILRFDKAGALLHQIRMGDHVDFPFRMRRVGGVKRRVPGKRTPGAVVERAAPVAQYGHGRVQMALLAHVQPAFGRKVRRIDDGFVDSVRGLRRGEPGLYVYGPRPVASLAPDPVRRRLVFAFHERRRLRITVVARHAPVRNEPVETGVVHLVSGAEVPFSLLRIPGQGEFEISPAFFRDIRPRRRAAAYCVLYFPNQAMRFASVRSRSEFFEPETAPVAVRTIRKTRARVLHDHAAKILDHGGVVHGVKRIRHPVLLEPPVLLLMAVETGFVSRKIGGQVPKTNVFPGGRRGVRRAVRGACAAS